MTKNSTQRGYFLMALLALGACSKTQTGGSLALNMVTKSTTLAAAASPLSEDFQILSPSWSPLSAGSNTAAGLTSLKYVFGGISICESLTTEGSAFSSPQGCLSIYSGPVVGDGSSGAITPDTLATYASSQIDMMDATSRAKANASVALTSNDVRSYNYAVINWYTPIAVKACADAGGGVTVCSQAGTASGTTTTSSTSMRTTTAAEAVVISANGGSFFKFQKPFAISTDDITAKTAFTVDMVFNPEGIIAVSDQGADGNLRSSNASMYVPMLNIAPVPRKGTQKTMRETYLSNDGCISSGTAGGKYRIELYYNSDDPTSVLGATGAQIATAGASGFPIVQTDYGAKIVEIATASDGSLTLKIPGATAGAANKSFITGLNRGANDSDVKLDFADTGTPSTTCSFTYTAGVDVSQ